MALIRLYEQALCSDRCPDAVAAAMVLLPIMVGIFAPVLAIAAMAR